MFKYITTNLVSAVFLSFLKYMCIWGNIHTDHSLCRLKIATKQCKNT